MELISEAQPPRGLKQSIDIILICVLRFSEVKCGKLESGRLRNQLDIVVCYL